MTHTTLSGRVATIVALQLFVSGALVSQTPAKWVAAIDLTIGAGDQPIGPMLFEEIRGLNQDAQGRIFVVESKASQVRIFSATGQLLYTIGRAGEGPGDLRDPCCLAFAPDGKLWVEEEGNHRFSAFTLGATKAVYAYSVRMPPSNNGYGSGDRISWNARNFLVNISGVHIPDRPFSGILRSSLDTTGAVRLVDTIMPAPNDSIAYFKFDQVINGNPASTTYTQYYGPMAVRAFGPGGMSAAAVNTNYAVTWKDGEGKRIALLQRPGKGPPLSEKEKETAEKRDKMIADRIGKALPFKVPATKPVIAELGFDLDGRLWIRRSVIGGTPREADVYDRTGRQIAVAIWPANVDLVSWAVRGQIGIGVLNDADGSTRVVRLRFN